ncbi:calcineurin-like phosphoesterase, putative [Phytophthora infestans T30-4]|uniref:Calcineurin-like phosphoesterase, putative n=1 Tax=Phytophthora infestans (strain T30-4) TaxID=403677 RepID=D0NER6_PHYIT|nr:calcineurin-like phosphoesterase, putative [Phytophthora infestans T30-4]EEY56348.1 calcineurin-like phosphoesterase, putative [Phytophthora infestans T30-4]|eukprot:XP_002902422.1 calcineurin-like phosphoesterase, putative [Phytophthora infestans T30-4]
MVHQGRHDCFGSNTVCAFLPRNETQIANLKLSVNTTIVQHLGTVEVKFARDFIDRDDVVAVYLVDPEESNDVEGDPLSDFIDYVYANESRVLESGIHSIVFGPLVNMRASYQIKYLRKVASFDFDEFGEFRPAFEVLENQRPQSFFVFGDLGTSVLQEPFDELDFDYSHPERHFYGLDMVSRLAKWGDERTVMERIRQDFDESLRDDADDDAPEYAALIHIGDISYAKGKSYRWDQYGAVVQSVASRLPYMVGVGNHEYDYIDNGEGHDLSGKEAALSNGWHPDGGNFGDDSHGECGVPYARRFHMPEAMDATSNPPFWYSFRIGMTHHVILSSEHRCTVGSPMRGWLEREFRDHVDRGLTPWLVVHLHRPLYCSESYEGDHFVGKLLRGCFEDLFAANNVDFVFSGHYHAYERTCPVYQDECRERDGRAQAPTHIMIGSGGAELDDVSYFQADWSRSRQQEYGHGRLHIYNASHAHFEFVRARDRVVTDAVWVVSERDY